MFTQQKFIKKFNFDIDENGIKVENYYIFQTEKFKNQLNKKTFCGKYFFLMIV